jgi:hypothetical protein
LNFNFTENETKNIINNNSKLKKIKPKLMKQKQGGKNGKMFCTTGNFLIHKLRIIYKTPYLITIEYIYNLSNIIQIVFKKLKIVYKYHNINLNSSK